MGDIMKYNGNCHCKAIQFEFESEEITTALQCNCSICIRKNSIMSKSYIESKDFKLIKGDDNLSLYQWGDHVVNNYFCKACGIHLFHDITYDQGKYRINLGCVNNIEPRNLDIIQFDGKNEL